jgi:cbb3-type cytochrome oxidase maturation protein
MEILFLLIPLAVALMVVAVVFFLWTVKTGQYDDLEGAAHRILMDDDDPLIPGNAPKQPAPEGSLKGTASEGKSEDDRTQ